MTVIFYPMELVRVERDLPVHNANLEFASTMADSEAQISTMTLVAYARLDSLELIVNLVRTETSTNKPNSS